MRQNLLAVDAGQTGIKLQWADPSGIKTLTMPGVATDRALLPQLAESILHVSAMSHAKFSTVAVGTTGLTSAENDARKLRSSLPGVDRVLLAHDSVTSYLGALGEGLGAVIAAGTGVVTLGVGPKAVARVDGWGHIMGDAGSGYWIGQQVLIAVMRAHDGRGHATALTESATTLWPELAEAYIQLQSNPERVSVVASLAREADRLALTDEVAAKICQRAGEELAWSAHAALLRVTEPGIPAPNQVACLGGVFNGTAVSNAFEDKLQQLQPGVQLVPAQGTGLSGAVTLASLPENHPLRGLVSEGR